MPKEGPERLLREENERMDMGGRRGIEALTLLLVILMVVGVLVPLTARAAPFFVRGLVSTCGGPLPYPDGATVTLVDANGILPPQTTTTLGGGSYSFSQPPPASYTIAVERSRYFSAATTTPVLFDGSHNVNIDVCMDAFGSPPKVLTVTVQDSGNNPIAGASVSAYLLANGRLATKEATNASGKVDLSLWATTFVVRASAPNLPTLDQSVDVAASSTATITLATTTDALFGHVTDSDGAPLTSGVVAWLYNPAAANTSLSRLIPATVHGSLYEFEASRAPAGTYTLIVDADGHLSSKASVTITGTPIVHDVTLAAAPRERYESLVLYGTADWNNLTLWRNLTLNADSTLTGLGPADLRDLRLQIDSTLGNGNGVLDAAEITAFQNWVTAKGPPYVTTNGFFTTNGRAYNETTGTFAATVSPSLATPDARVWINATASYKIQGAPPYIAAGTKSYFVNMTVVPDSDAPSYKDNVYLVQLPRYYEMNNSATRIVPQGAPVTATNFTRFTVDPGVMPAGSPFPQAQLKVEQSLKGVARAKVIAPSGKFYESNTDYKNYQVFVANNTDITYSAATSSHPNQPSVCNLNFTWRFTGSDTRWGCEPKYKYLLNGTKTVNLTMREGSGNFSYRDFTVFVDDIPPVAAIRTNRTGSGRANGMTLRVDQGIPISFSGTLSRDMAYPGKSGAILDSGYAWDFDGNGTDRTGRDVTWAFARPGVFNVNLTVTDSVGWKGVIATLTARVNDTKAPVPAFDILDSEKDWAVITSPFERKTIALNASRTTDNFDNISQINFTWTIPGPVKVNGTLLTGSSHTLYGVNVSFAWDEWNLSYKVVLTVHDSGYQGGPGPGAGPAKPNWANLTRNITVQIDKAFHADLSVHDLKLSTMDPAEGDSFTLSVNVTDKAGWATASSVIVELLAISGGTTTSVPVTGVQWFKGGVETSDTTIPAGSTVKLVLTAHLSGQGNKTLRVNIRDSTEPYTALGDNHPQAFVNVHQPWWQPWAVGAAVAGVIILAVFAMYARRKIKAGEWRSLRGRRREKGAEEKEKPRREVKEEKKRL
ncbi:MAG TPA: PKD domain-containing protein [Thermoplasmata archaeon]|nr:PKD domain-containing protein [Thermoplasmata archaeon]